MLPELILYMHAHISFKAFECLLSNNGFAYKEADAVRLNQLFCSADLYPRIGISRGGGGGRQSTALTL